jgi:hypothetical protein
VCVCVRHTHVSAYSRVCVRAAYTRSGMHTPRRQRTARCDTARVLACALTVSESVRSRARARATARSDTRVSQPAGTLAVGARGRMRGALDAGVRQAGRQAGRQTDRQTDRKTGRQAGRQTDRLKDGRTGIQRCLGCGGLPIESATAEQIHQLGWAVAVGPLNGAVSMPCASQVSGRADSSESDSSALSGARLSASPADDHWQSPVSA